MVEPCSPVVGTSSVWSNVTVRARLRVVLNRLPEGDAQGEDQDDDERADAPADHLPASLQATAFVPLDRGQGAHGL